MQIVQALRGRQALVTHAFPVSAGMGGCNFAGHGGIPFLMIPVFSHFWQVSLPWGWGEDQMPLKRPDGRWGIIKINVINELPFLVSADGSAPELMGAFSETTGHLFFTVRDAS